MTTASKLIKQIRLLTAELQDEAGAVEDETFLPDETEIANRTSRSMGAVGAKAVVPRVVRDWIQPTDKVLDFGAGKDAAHAVRLKGEGYDVTAHEFGSNQKEGLHDPQALTNGPYDVVYASNVLNVQSKPQMMERTLRQIRRALKPGGIFIANFPKQPRKMSDLTPDQLAAQIASVFGVPAMSVRPGGMPKAVDRMPAEPIFFVRYKGFKGMPAPEAAPATEMTMTEKTQAAVKAAIAAIESVKKLTARKVHAGHMQAQVFKDDVLVLETNDGTVYFPLGDFSPNVKNDIKRAKTEEEIYIAAHGELGAEEDEIESLSLEHGKWLARSSAPGYMDKTDYSMSDTEEEAWSYLIDMDPTLFTWTVELTASDEEGGTAHINMESDAAAKAMVDAVQSIDGSKLERDGDFVYVGLTGNGETVKGELDGMGFNTEEG